MEEYRKKPYLETNYTKRKVVERAIVDDGRFFPRDWYLDIGAILRGEDSFGEKENLDRVKLPCFCSFEWKGSRRLGMIIFLWYKETGMCTSTWRYGLIDMSEQSHKQVGNIVSQGSLEYLLEKYKINIGKAYIDFCETYY